MLFITITTLHQESDFLMGIHIELISIILILTSILLFFKINSINTLNHENAYPITICFLLALSPLISSYANIDYLNIINDEEYKSFIKTLFITPLIFLYLKYATNSDKKLIANLYVFFIGILGIYFFYRYLALNEIREYDLRPKLKIKHGDPNFLCTIFSIGVPLCIKISFNNFKKENNKQSIFFMLLSLFLIICALATQSRMGIVALIIGLIYLFTKSFWNYSKKTIIAIVIFATTLLTFIYYSGSLERFQNINDKSNSDRVLTYQNGIAIISEFPILGVGMHKAQLSFYKNTHYPNFQSEFNQLDIHNTFLKIFAELGIWGLFLFLNIINYCWPKGEPQNTNIYFLKSSYIILVISCLTIGITYKDFLYFHLFILAGLSIENNSKKYDLIN